MIKTKPTHCKTCNNIIDAHTATNGEHVPMESDISICFYCGVISKFDNEMNLVAMPFNELLQLEFTDPNTYYQLQKAQRLINERIKLN